MSSTNKTTHYELSQFLGTDKPAWLNDYNADMSKIDSGINTAQSTATSADGKATTNATAIGTLSSLTTDVKTDIVSAINEVDGHADTAQATANSASNTANSASTSVTNLTNYLTMNTFTTPTATISAGATYWVNELGCASNASGSLGKVYGRIFMSSTINGTVTVTFATPLRPTSNITINGGLLVFWGAQGQDANIPTSTSFTIATDGTCTVSLSVNANQQYRLFFINSVIFATDFGDLPQPN